MGKYERLLQEILVECDEDHVGLWSIVHAVRWELGEKDPVKVRQLTMRLVEDLLRQTNMAAGFPTNDGKGFTPWSSTRDETLARINREWDLLGREPSLGEIVWFTTLRVRDGGQVL